VRLWIARIKNEDWAEEPPRLDGACAQLVGWIEDDCAALPTAAQGRHGGAIRFADARRSEHEHVLRAAMDEQLAALRLTEHDTGLRFAQARLRELARRRKMRAAVKARAALRPVERDSRDQADDKGGTTAPL